MKSNILPPCQIDTKQNLLRPSGRRNAINTFDANILRSNILASKIISTLGQKIIQNVGIADKNKIASKVMPFNKKKFIVNPSGYNSNIYGGNSY